MGEIRKNRKDEINEQKDYGPLLNRTECLPVLEQTPTENKKKRKYDKKVAYTKLPSEEEILKILDEEKILDE